MQSNSFNVNNIIIAYHSRIIEICSKIPGIKTLMIHDDISKMINRICGRKLLNKGGIDKIIQIADYSIDKNINKIICFLPSDVDAVNKIIRFIKSDKEHNIKRTLVLAFIPFLNEACRYLLTKEELPLEVIGLFDLKIGWLPVDEDILTLNNKYLYPSTFLHNNTTWSYFYGQMIADALLYGLDRPTYLCKIFALGETARWTFKGMHDECEKNKFNYKTSDGKTGNTSIFVFSRDLDYVTPFCLGITFQSMLHEVVGIELDTVNLTEEITGKSDSQKLVVNSDNKIYSIVRNLPMMSVMSVCSKYLQELKDKKDKIAVLKKPSELKEFVDNSLESLLKEDKEGYLCYDIMEYIINETTIKDRVDELMCAQASLLQANEEYDFPKKIIIEYLTCKYRTKQFDAIRLLCLWTATHDGLPNNMYHEMSRLLCHSLGYQIMSLLYNLRKLKLFAPRSDFIAQNSISSSSTSVAGSGGQSSINVSNHLDINLLKNTSSNQNLSLLSSSSSASNLNAMKNLVTATYKSKYFNLRNLLKLFSNKQINAGSDCLNNSYIFGGHHTPLCSALIEEICHKTSQSLTADYKISGLHTTSTASSSNLSKKGGILFSPLDEAMKNLNIPPETMAGYGRTHLSGGTSAREGATDTIIACFVGGCTHSEITALRQLAMAKRWKLIILTSNIIGNKDLFMHSRLAD